eukprot:10137310-Karenia_brevis.AAC.1
MHALRTSASASWEPGKTCLVEWMVSASGKPYCSRFGNNRNDAKFYYRCCDEGANDLYMVSPQSKLGLLHLCKVSDGRFQEEMGRYKTALLKVAKMHVRMLPAKQKQK